MRQYPPDGLMSPCPSRSVTAVDGAQMGQMIDEAVAALARKRVSRITLPRPAVEAGENLGFLPGSLTDKIDPYLRPPYDALHDTLVPLGGDDCHLHASRVRCALLRCPGSAHRSSPSLWSLVCQVSSSAPAPPGAPSAVLLFGAKCVCYASKKVTFVCLNALFFIHLQCKLFRTLPVLHQLLLRAALYRQTLSLHPFVSP